MIANKQSLWLLMLLYIVMPGAFIIGDYLFIGLILFQMFLIAGRTPLSGNKLTLMLLNMYLYSCVSVAGFRLYDFVIVFAFIEICVARRGKIILLRRIIPFFIVVLLNMIIHNSSESSLLEVLRYIICILLLITTINEKFDFNSIINEMICIALGNLYFAFIVFIMIRHGIFENYSGLIATNVYIFTKELRWNGFFSDPNKYMAFCFALLFISEAFIRAGRKKIAFTIIILISSVLSFSRTALIVIAVFVAFKILIIIRKKMSQSSFYILLIGVITLFSVIVAVGVLMPDLINRVLNYLYVASSTLLGRVQALQLSTTIQEDNRTRIWRMALQLIKQSPISGYGWASNEYLLPYPTHNTVLALLLDGGVIVLVSYLFMFWPLLSYKRWDIIVSCCIVSSLLLDLQGYRIWFFLLGLILCKNAGINPTISGVMKRTERQNTLFNVSTI